MGGTGALSESCVGPDWWVDTGGRQGGNCCKDKKVVDGFIYKYGVVTCRTRGQYRRQCRPFSVTESLFPPMSINFTEVTATLFSALSDDVMIQNSPNHLEWHLSFYSINPERKKHKCHMSFMVFNKTIG